MHLVTVFIRTFNDFFDQFDIWDVNSIHQELSVAGFAVGVEERCWGSISGEGSARSKSHNCKPTGSIERQVC